MLVQLLVQVQVQAVLGGELVVASWLVSLVSLVELVVPLLEGESRVWL